ncbi:Oidioi.mRNA.OKI2018_I69.PAR.g9265.t1.cds [Oikopleura dioica]|uniref:Oidioi.mRNA.OKI2018_I69.PAR.g9265.t1.cds n=1 Tax=Oikopleura dioica TaxID=34765 RepID=A0ABN7RMI4_OIKDI|nr:Oidioi.mRNA.OKI2018_I69.PAR.g9265.t1.cds [Oikopleura dioica]
MEAPNSSYQRFNNKDSNSQFFNESSSINLTSLPRQQTHVPSNLDLCNDELFDELFPNNEKLPPSTLSSNNPSPSAPQSVLYGHIANELRKNSMPEAPRPQSTSTLLQTLFPHSLPQQLSNLRMSSGEMPAQSSHHRNRNQLSESSAIEQHMMYLMDQTPNPVPLQISEVPEHEERQIKAEPPASPDSNGHGQDLWMPPNSSHHSSYAKSRNSSVDSDEDYVPSLSNTTKELVSNMIKSEPVDIEELTKKRSKRGRKRKSTESENELTRAYDRESNEYKKKRLRNNIAVRKSRDKAKQRQMEIQHKLMELAEENKSQKQVIAKLKEDFDKLESCFKDRNSRLEESIKLNVRMRQFINDLPRVPAQVQYLTPPSLFEPI